MQSVQSAYTVSLDQLRYENLSISRDADGEAIFMAMNVRPRPCYTWAVVNDIIDFQKNFAVAASLGTTQPRCLVWASDSPGIFSLGGDLTLFRSVIETQDRKSLMQYAQDCVIGLGNHLNAPQAVTVSVLEGDALGAGLETALSSDVVIAERGIRAGFPEVLFNLVPGHGAYYLLARRIGPQAADRMIRDGDVLSADELHKLGLIDILVEPGEGRQAVRELIERRRKTWNAFQALQHIKRHHVPITREALLASARIWVEAAMRLSDRNLRMMERLVRAQEKRVSGSATSAEVIELVSEQVAA